MNHTKLFQPKQFRPLGDGQWTLGPDCRVLLMDGGAPWEVSAACAELLGQEYPALAAAPRLHGGDPQPGDLVIRVGQPQELDGIQTFQEGFVLRAGPVLELEAQSPRAVMFGLRTALETLTTGGLPYGTMADWPATGERGLHLDAGRKFYSKQWIAEIIRTLSRNRMNVLWLHFSENEGFRIASDRHPELPSLLHLSKDDVRELIRLAGAYQIDLNPALDCPGHLGQALQEHPRWRLDREMAEPLWSALDITQRSARDFLFSILDEYMELFAGSKVFHIGGDEFIDFNHFELFPKMEAYAKEHLGPDCGGVDVYVDFLNEAIARVRAKGFQVRVWNDGLLRPDLAEHVKLDPDVQIAFWSNWDRGMAPLKAFLDRGYQVVNYNAEYLYYILLIRKDYTDPDPDKLLTEWTPGMFPNHPLVGSQTVPQSQSSQFLGCCYSIWSDWPDLQTEDEVKARSEASLAAMGARCWQGAEPVR